MGVYLLIRKRAVLRYISAPHRERGKLRAVYICLCKYASILTHFHTKINIKMTKKAPFLVILSEAEPSQIPKMISLVCRLKSRTPG